MATISYHRALEAAKGYLMVLSPYMQQQQQQQRYACMINRHYEEATYMYMICICRYEHNTTNAQAYVACVASMHVTPPPNHISMAATGAGMGTDMFSGVSSTTQAGQQLYCPLLYPGAAPFTDQVLQHWHGLTLYDELLYATVGKITTCT